MTRRQAIVAGLAAVAAPLLPAAPSDFPPDPRPIWRLAGTQWVRVRMRDLRAGDRFRIELTEGYPPVEAIATGDPYIAADGDDWEIMARESDA